MHVLRVINSMNPAHGGVVEAVIQSSNELNNYGHIVTIVCLDAPDAPWIRQSSRSVIAIGPGIGKYGICASAGRWMFANIATFDCVIIEGLWQFHGMIAWLACKQKDIPYCIFSHGMMDVWFQKNYPNKHIKKQIYWSLIESLILSDASTVCFTNIGESLNARDTYFPYSFLEATVPLGTTAPTSIFKEQSEIVSKTNRTLLFLGRIHPKKGIDLVLKAFQVIAKEIPGKLNDLHLIICGPIECEEYNLILHNLADTLKNQNLLKITFSDTVTANTRWNLLSRADLMVLTSHQENFGMVVAEALACQTSVLISNQVNSYHAVQDMKAGIVCLDTVDSVQIALKYWLHLDLETLNIMKQNAYACYQKYFSIFASTSILETVLTSIVHKHHEF